MPIVAYTGLPGHGKSYGAVEHVVLPALRQGRTVVTNLPLNLAELQQELGAVDVRAFDVRAVEKEPSRIEEYSVPGAVIVIDEAWRLFPQGMMGNKIPEPFREFLAEHRHKVDESDNSQQIVLITQDLKQVATFARDLVEETFRVRKLGRLGLNSRFIVDVYSKAVTGQNPPDRLRVRQIPGKYSAKVWRFYQSHTKRQGEGSGANEAAMDKRGVIWRSPMFWLGGPVLLGLFVVGVWKVWGFLHRSPVKAKQQAEGVVKSAVRGVSSAPWSAAQWRIVGEIPEWDRVYISDGTRYVILSEARYCDRDISGFLVCKWEGREISNQVQYYRGAQSPERSLEVLGSTVAVAK